MGSNSLDLTFDPNMSNQVHAIAIQSDGKILIGGEFTTVGGVVRNYIARLNSDGTLDAGFDPNVNGNVPAIAIQSDGKILIGGDFTTVGGVIRNRIARCMREGDRSFTCITADSSMVYVYDQYALSLCKIDPETMTIVMEQIIGSFNIKYMAVDNIYIYVYDQDNAIIKRYFKDTFAFDKDLYNGAGLYLSNLEAVN